MIPLAFRALVFSVIAGVIPASLAASPTPQEVNVYTYRQEELIRPILNAFEQASGIKVNVIFAKDGLIERLKREGRNSPADVLLTTDIGRLQEAVSDDLLASVNSEALNAAIPAEFRHPEGKWFGLTKRARIMYVSKERVDAGEITRYEDLADAKWKGRVCTRPAKHDYNIALIASLIAHDGEAATQAWLQGVHANLAQKPQGNDRSQVKAIKEGICDVSLGNSYYYGNMLADPEQKAWADAVTLVFPNQADRGTHVNISGLGITRSAPHPDAALKLAEFLASPKAQKMYAEQNFEYPVDPNVALSGIVASWGNFKADALSLEKIASLRSDASKLVDRVGFDN